MHFIQLLSVNFHNDALVRSLKTLMDNANGWPPDSHHNLLFMQFRFWKMFGCFIDIKPLCRSFTVIIKASFFITSHYLTKKTETASNTLQKVELFYFHWVHMESIFFTSLILSRWSNIVEMLTLIEWEISLTLWRGFCSTSIFKCWLSVADTHPLPT